ncbi:MAG: ribbon-helix-helix domain-containing protein [Acutalibacteraceae bacterium]|jgi:metal-responsive CopG/Arc/MetJ family transcriptional regulator
MPTEKPRYTVIVDKELLKEIDDFRFENRYPSRSAATSELIRIGIEQLKKEQKAAKKAQKISPPAEEANQQSSRNKNACSE